MMQVMADKTVSAQFESVSFEFRPRQKLEDIVLSDRYFFKVTKTLMDTHQFLKRVAQVFKTEAAKVLEGSTRRADRMKRFASAAVMSVSAHSLLRKECPRTDTSDDRSSQWAYSDTEYDEEEAPRRKMKSRDCRRR